MNQALGIWSELWMAYYCHNGYGGNTAEIYAYRLMPYEPKLNQGLPSNENSTIAKEVLYNLMCKFKNETGCDIKVDNYFSITDWFENSGFFNHRVHVTITH